MLHDSYSIRQDLFSSVLTGSGRVLSHDTFSELHWKRDPFRPSIFRVPTGFEAYADVLGNEFLAISEDIHALRALVDTMDVDQRDAISIMHLDNHQASIESRLYNLGRDPLRHERPALYCCICAGYLCTYMLFNDVWSSSLLPSYLTAWLLENLHLSNEQGDVSQYWDLFIWVVCIGGALTQSQDEQIQYALLLRNHLEANAFTIEVLVLEG